MTSPYQFPARRATILLAIQQFFMLYRTGL
jgi:hypothetical protein